MARTLFAFFCGSTAAVTAFALIAVFAEGRGQMLNVIFQLIQPHQSSPLFSAAEYLSFAWVGAISGAVFFSVWSKSPPAGHNN